MNNLTNHQQKLLQRIQNGEKLTRTERMVLQAYDEKSNNRYITIEDYLRDIRLSAYAEWCAQQPNLLERKMLNDIGVDTAEKALAILLPIWIREVGSKEQAAQKLEAYIAALRAGNLDHTIEKRLGEINGADRTQEA